MDSYTKVFTSAKLKGLNLKVLLTKKTFVNSNQIIDETHKEMEFSLRKVTEDELFSLRLSGKPGFVLKKDGSTYYYSEIPAYLSLTNQELFSGCLHKCTKHPVSCCSRLSAAPDSAGGCQKVRDMSLDSFKGLTPRRVNNSKRIEKYPFIVLGFETFNTLCDAFSVAKCLNFEKDTRVPIIFPS